MILISRSSPSSPLVLKTLASSYLSTEPSSSKSMIMGRPPDSQTRVPSLFSRAMYSCFLTVFSLRFNCERIEGTTMIRWTALTCKSYYRMKVCRELKSRWARSRSERNPSKPKDIKVQKHDICRRLCPGSHISPLITPILSRVLSFGPMTPIISKAHCKYTASCWPSDDDVSYKVLSNSSTITFLISSPIWCGLFLNRR